MSAYLQAGNAIGVTGSRHGISREQCIVLRSILITFRAICETEEESSTLYTPILHHGDCVGADKEAHKVALSLGYGIYIHPPKKTEWRAFCPGAFYTEAPKDYLSRNQDIVNKSVFLIALPRSVEPPYTGGTWYTIKYARSVYLPGIIISPTGETEAL